MSSSTVRLYEALKTEYPNKVYLGQFDQAADLRSTDSVVMLEMISQTSSVNKDIAKRDQITYKIHVVGILQKEVEQKANEIRDLIEPYNDEYIYLMKFEGIDTIYEDQAETYRKVVNFTCFPNTDGLNMPGQWYEYYAYMDFISGAITVLNGGEINYVHIDWQFERDNIDNVSTFTAFHTYSINDIKIYWEFPNHQGNQMDLQNDVDSSSIVLTTYETDLFQDTYFLIRVRKDVSGHFNGV